MKLRVGFELSTVAFPQKTGTGVYADELVKAYQKVFAGDEITHSYRLSRRWKGRRHLLDIPKGGHRQTVFDPFTFWQGWGLDIFHGLNTRLPLLSGCQKIATVHDLFALFGQFADRKFLEDQSRKLRTMLGRADHFIVPAEYTRKEMIQKLGYGPEKISVVGHGVREVFQAPIDRERSKREVFEKSKIHTPFFLFVGTLERRKNVARIVEAFALFCRKNPSNMASLVLVGHGGFGFEEIQNAISNSSVKNRTLNLGFVSADHLKDLYQACDVFLFPSLEEGYGIPVIEAMACGAPVITSTTTALPEAAGGHAVLVDPTDVAALTLALEAVAGRSDRILAMAEQGHRYARRLTWELAAKNTREVYLNRLRNL